MRVGSPRHSGKLGGGRTIKRVTAKTSSFLVPRRRRQGEGESREKFHIASSFEFMGNRITEAGGYPRDSLAKGQKGGERQSIFYTTKNTRWAIEKE